MTVLVTGAAGHLGANLVRALLAQGRSVRALVYRDRRALEGLELEIFQGDVSNPASMEEACAGCEIVYHLAVFISLRDEDWPRMKAINVEGTRNVVEACLKQGVRRLVHVSSVHALQNEPMDQAIDEMRQLVDVLPYVPLHRLRDLDVPCCDFEVHVRSTPYADETICPRGLQPSGSMPGRPSPVRKPAEWTPRRGY